LNRGYVASWLEDALQGRNVGEMIENQVRIPINVRMADEARDDLGALENLYIDTPTGAKIPLHAVATIQKTTGPNAVNHENGRRRIVVMANTQGRDLGSVVDDVKAVLARDVSLPDGYFIDIGGQFE